MQYCVIVNSTCIIIISISREQENCCVIIHIIALISHLGGMDHV